MVQSTGGNSSLKYSGISVQLVFTSSFVLKLPLFKVNIRVKEGGKVVTFTVRKSTCKIIFHGFQNKTNRTIKSDFTKGAENKDKRARWECSSH